VIGVNKAADGAPSRARRRRGKKTRLDVEASGAHVSWRFHASAGGGCKKSSVRGHVTCYQSTRKCGTLG
jgi:hypothetical protein